MRDFLLSPKVRSIVRNGEALPETYVAQVITRIRYMPMVRLIVRAVRLIVHGSTRVQVPPESHRDGEVCCVDSSPTGDKVL